MALSQVVFGRAGYPLGEGVLPLLDSVDLVSEDIVPSGSSQQTSITAPQIGQRPICLVGTDTAIYVSVGTNPDATNTATRVYVPANGQQALLCNIGDKAAVVTA